MEITGLGNMKDLIFEELSTRGLPIIATDYDSANNQDGITLLVYDGLQIKEAMNYVKDKNLKVVVIFIELDRALFVGNLKMDKNEGTICAECGISRIKEYFAPTKMHQTIMEREYTFAKTFLLPEEVQILCDQIVGYLENPSLHESVGTFSLDFYTTIYREISGYTNCHVCDYRENKLEELIFAVKGGKENVIIVN